MTAREDGLREARYLADRFEWAAPGDQQEDAWLVRFCDKDCGEAIFTGPDAEAEAWAYWDRYARSYNLYVFRLARLSTPSDTALREAWQPIETAPKDGTIIWAQIHDDLFPRVRPGRPDLERWNGVQVPLRHPGLADDGFDMGWNVAAPVGNGGFPDEWIAGWMPRPEPPARHALSERGEG